MDGGHLERFVERQRRQDSRHPSRHHRLAGAGRTDQQQVVAAGRRDFERSARQQLTADIGKIGLRRWHRRLRRRDVGTHRSSDGSAPRPLRRATTPGAPSGRRRRPPRWRSAGQQDARTRRRAGRRPQSAGRRALAGSFRRATVRRGRRCRQSSRRSTMPCAARMPSAIGRSNGGAGLSHVGRRQVDRDAVRRKFESGVANRAPHAVAALAHAGVRQPDHREDRHAERHVHFDVHGTGFDAEEGGGPQRREHAPRRCKKRAQPNHAFNELRRRPSETADAFCDLVDRGTDEIVREAKNLRESGRPGAGLSSRGRCRS